MSIEENKKFVIQYLDDVFSRGNLARLDNYVAGARMQTFVSDLVMKWRRAFPDFRLEVGDIIAEGDNVVTEETMTGTHRGDYESQALGRLPATGNRVRWTRLAVRRIERGRVVDGYFEEDEVGLLQQLGAIPPTVGGDVNL